MRGYILIVLLAASTAAGHACSCMGPQPVCAIEMGTSAIFRGIVVERTLEDDVHYAKKPDGSTVELHGGGRYRVRFAVEETFSGEPRQEMTVYTNSQGPRAGFRLRMVGNTWCLRIRIRRRTRFGLRAVRARRS